ISYLLVKTAADMEEERAIKEMCYKSGEYYGIQSLQEHQSTKTVSSALEEELLPLGAVRKDLQKGDGNTVPTTFNNSKRQGVTSVSLKDNTRTNLRTFENGGGDCFMAQRNLFGEGKGSESLVGQKEPIISKYSNMKATNFTELVKKHQFKGVKKKKWISEETRKSPSTVTGKAMHTSNPQIKANYQRNDQIKADESTSYIPSMRAAGRRTFLNSSEPGRSTYVFYRNVTVFQEPKLNGCMDKNTSGPYNAPTWRKRNPHAKTFSKLRTTTQSQEEMETNNSNIKPLPLRSCVSVQLQMSLQCPLDVNRGTWGSGREKGAVEREQYHNDAELGAECQKWVIPQPSFIYCLQGTENIIGLEDVGDATWPRCVGQADSDMEVTSRCKNLRVSGKRRHGFTKGEMLPPAWGRCRRRLLGTWRLSGTPGSSSHAAGA
ncbi:PREDICTED: uncharacterized protein C12orf50 homolog, partial [Tinamus guttatus]|uniref:uncharacterized protein C12orf50 homolog n=1 Tax=Tinamus guttatus TaxID=94827 RepID=UPI00052ED138